LDLLRYQYQVLVYADDVNMVGGKQIS